MAAESKKRQAKTGKQAKKPSSELRAPTWSVVSFEKCEAGGLTYADAEQKLSELEAQKVSGLCIVTDEVAARITSKK
jgi:hypothetical protein